MILIAILIFVAGIVYFVVKLTKPKQQDIKEKNYTIDEKYNAAKVEKQNEVDRILEKINKSGIQSLNNHEKEILDSYSKTLK